MLVEAARGWMVGKGSPANYLVGQLYHFNLWILLCLRLHPELQLRQYSNAALKYSTDTTYKAVCCFDKTKTATALKNNLTGQPCLYQTAHLGLLCWSGIAPICMQTDTAMLADIPSTEASLKGDEDN